MHARMLHILIQPLLLLFLLFSPICALTVLPSSRPSPIIRHTSLHARAPSETTDPAAGHNLKFKEYPNWIKDKSKQIWESHTERMARKAAMRDYISPYMTKFSDKEEGWWAAFSFGKMWKHFIWETMPSVWTSPELPQEDVFLLRAMEQPTYSSVNELPVGLKPKQVPGQGRICDGAINE